MEKNITLQQTKSSWTSIMASMVETIKMPFEWLRRYYSSVLEREVSYKQMWQLLNAQLAFVMAVFPADGPITVRLICCAWFVYALRACRG